MKRLLVLSAGAALLVYGGYLALFEGAGEVLYGTVTVLGILSVLVASVLEKPKSVSIIESFQALDPFAKQTLGWVVAIVAVLLVLPRGVQVYILFLFGMAVVILAVIFAIGKKKGQ